MVRFSRVCLAAVPMCHPQVIKSRQWMRHDGGNTLQYQDPYEGLRALPLKVMECGFRDQFTGERLDQRLVQRGKNPPCGPVLACLPAKSRPGPSAAATVAPNI